jgi:hypothetical protein
MTHTLEQALCEGWETQCGVTEEKVENCESVSRYMSKRNILVFVLSKQKILILLDA